MDMREVMESVGATLESAYASKEEHVLVRVAELEVLMDAAREISKPVEACCKPYNELEATVPLMLSDDYKARFVAEYRQTKYRYERLKAFCNRIEAARMTPERDEIEEPKHDCPLELLRAQQRAMGEYLHTLEIRAVIEQIEL